MNTNKEFQVLVVNKFDKTFQIIIPHEQNGNFKNRSTAEEFARRAVESKFFDSVQVMKVNELHNNAMRF
jgi:hypothetical protein